MMKIRLAKNEDYVSVARLRRQTIRNVNSKDYPPKIISYWSSKVKTADLKKDAKKFKRWVALERDKIIGFCEHNFEGHITRMYVHKDFLGKGIGTRLLEIAEESLKKLKFKEIKLEATITAKDFYFAKQYRLIGKGIGSLHEFDCGKFTRALARQIKEVAPQVIFLGGVDFSHNRPEDITVDPHWQHHVHAIAAGVSTDQLREMFEGFYGEGTALVDKPFYSTEIYDRHNWLTYTLKSYFKFNPEKKDEEGNPIRYHDRLDAPERAELALYLDSLSLDDRLVLRNLSHRNFKYVQKHK